MLFFLLPTEIKLSKRYPNNYCQLILNLKMINLVVLHKTFSKARNNEITSSSVQCTAKVNIQSQKATMKTYKSLLPYGLFLSYHQCLFSHASWDPLYPQTLYGVVLCTLSPGD